MVNWITKKSEIKKIEKRKILKNPKNSKNNNLEVLYSLKALKTNIEKLKNTKKRFVVLLGRSYGFDSISSEFMANLHTNLTNKSSISNHLLSNYVFITLPMINPDGVNHGYSRVDSTGANQMQFSKKNEKSKNQEIEKIRVFL